MGNLCSGPPDVPPNPDQVDLTHFELLKVVGKGGFGKVNAIQKRDSQSLMALKRMAKCEVIKKESHIRMIWVERNIMARLSRTNNPFLVRLEHAFQSTTELFLVMPFMQGGDLRYHLAKKGAMTEDEGRFYAAELVLGLEAMHNLKIVYRDLKPDNILLDHLGHAKLSDFGLSVQLEEKYQWKMKGNAGTSGYLAPEVCAGEYYGTAPDVFSLGITIYELLHGCRPFRVWKPEKNYIDRLKFHPDLSADARHFIRGLLAVDPRKRLACGPRGWAEVKAHPFFATIDWDKMMRREIAPPFTPDLLNCNCSNQADLADQLIDRKPEPIPLLMQRHFENFEFNTDLKTIRDRESAATAASGQSNNNSHIETTLPTGTVPSHEMSSNINKPADAGANKDGLLFHQRTSSLTSTKANQVAPAPMKDENNKSDQEGAAVALTQTPTNKEDESALPAPAFAPVSAPASSPVPVASSLSMTLLSLPAMPPAPAPSPIAEPAVELPGTPKSDTETDKQTESVAVAEPVAESESAVPSVAVDSAAPAPADAAAVAVAS